MISGGDLVSNLVAIQFSGGSAGQTLFQKILSLTTIGTFQVTDSYKLTFKCGRLSRAPNITTAGDNTTGMYISAEYYDYPDLWWVLSKGNTDLLASWWGVANQLGWGHGKIYLYDANYGGAYLKYEGVLSGTPTLTMNYGASQAGVGALTLQGLLEWTYERTEYDGQGGSQTSTATGGIGIAWTSMPASLMTNASDMSDTALLPYLEEFAQECEDKRQQLNT